MKKNANKLFLVAGLLAMSAVLLTGCGSRKKTDAVDSVIKISTAPEPTATPDPKNCGSGCSDNEWKSDYGK